MKYRVAERREEKQRPSGNVIEHIKLVREDGARGELFIMVREGGERVGRKRDEVNEIIQRRVKDGQIQWT